ncbi:MAG: hypothetical protein EOO43_01675 [Flavobacterium sp.]|nr:MAG: hypothetical protein EOO43_01675 [Flavobacterium sp.]
MTDWNIVKDSIEKDLLNRNLSDASIRIGAIKSIERLLVEYIEQLRLNPIELIGMIDKASLKSILSEYKDNGKLNGAEESVVNEIYYRIK